MEYVAIVIGVVCIYTAMLIKKWWNVTIVFTAIILVYLFAVFGVRADRVLMREWYSKINEIQIEETDNVRRSDGNVEIFLDDTWYKVSQVEEFDFEYLGYWVTTKDGKKTKVTDSDVIKLLKEVTEKE
jgi:hypothetical protein